MKKIFLLLFVVAILSHATMAENTECKGVVTTSEIPCTIFLPVVNGCSGVTVSLFYNGTYLETRDMGDYTSFYCNATFNYSDIGTYVFNYSTYDTGSIIVEEDNMLDIFNLSVYGFMFLLGLVFMLFMHIFREDYGSAVVYGSIAGAVFVIIGTMLVGGFEIVRGVTFVIDLNYYIAGLVYSIAVYNFVVSVNLWRVGKPRESSPFDMY